MIKRYGYFQHGPPHLPHVVNPQLAAHVGQSQNAPPGSMAGSIATSIGRNHVDRIHILLCWFKLCYYDSFLIMLILLIYLKVLFVIFFSLGEWICVKHRQGFHQKFFLRKLPLQTFVLIFVFIIKCWLAMIFVDVSHSSYNGI